jgi:hypothetical protein
MNKTEGAWRKHKMHHEAGHAVIARFYQLDFEYVIATEDENFLQFAHGVFPISEESIIVAFAGFRAQHILRKRLDHAYSSLSWGDVTKAQEIAETLWGNDDNQKNLRRLSLEAKRLVDKPDIRAAIEATAEALLARGALVPADVDEIIHDTRMRHQ